MRPLPDPDDVFPPPADPVEVCCVACGWTYMSDLMIPIRVRHETHWMCPVPSCRALGFMFDIFPTSDETQAFDDALFIDETDPDRLADDLDTDKALAHHDAHHDADDDFVPGDLPGRPSSPGAGDSSLADAFDPPLEWDPEMDQDFVPLDRPLTDPAHPDVRYFTREDYEQARAQGIYDQAAEEVRAWWISIERSTLNHPDQTIATADAELCEEERPEDIDAAP